MLFAHSTHFFPDSYIRGCCILDSFGQGLRLTGISNLTVDSNVFYNILGHGLLLGKWSRKISVLHVAVTCWLSFAWRCLWRKEWQILNCTLRTLIISETFSGISESGIKLPRFHMQLLAAISFWLYTLHFIRSVFTWSGSLFFSVYKWKKFFLGNWFICLWKSTIMQYLRPQFSEAFKNILTFNFSHLTSKIMEWKHMLKVKQRI